MVFRDDAVSGSVVTAFEVVGNLLSAPTQVDAEVVLPVFDGCTAAGARYGFSFECSEPRAGTNGVYDPGIVAATLVGCVATGPGTAGSAAATRQAQGSYNPGVSAGADPDLIGAEADCVSDGFDLGFPEPV